MSEMTYLEAISDALRTEMRRDESVFCLGQDIGAFGGAFKVTAGFAAEFGAERVLDMPLAENAIVGAATGAAIEGMRPVCEMQFADFGFTAEEVEAIRAEVVAQVAECAERALASPMPDPALAGEGVFADRWEPLGDGMAPWSRWAEPEAPTGAGPDARPGGSPDGGSAGLERRAA